MNTNTFAPRSIAINAPSLHLSTKSHVAVIGAGAFGGWSALYLRRKGLNVTLVDAWGAGNSRSSSGDDTRVIRSTYGANEFYFDMNVRAIELWKENQQRWNRQLFFNAGVIWFCYQAHNPLVDDSISFAKKHRMEYEKLSPADLAKRFPLINHEDLHHAYLDPFGGYLKARDSMQAVRDAFIAEGGNYIQAMAKPGRITSGTLADIQLSDGVTLQADAYLFACGSWLGQLFPEFLQDTITCTKQEVFYFGPPAGDSHAFDQLPAWIDLDGKDFYYGIPGNAQRGFKIGVDKRGVTFDPTHGERMLTPEVFREARKFIEHRFPKMKNAPLLESRVCPYENSPDGNFVFDQHPGAGNAWILGGGSGHGFKHGPALGEWVSQRFT